MAKAMLKPYYLRLQAIRITKNNLEELKRRDIGDGVFSDCFGLGVDPIGDWYVEKPSGSEIMPGDIKLIPLGPDDGTQLENRQS